MAIFVIVFSSDLVRYSNNYKPFQTVLNYLLLLFFKLKIEQLFARAISSSGTPFQIVENSNRKLFFKNFVHLGKFHLDINYQIVI